MDVGVIGRASDELNAIGHRVIAVTCDVSDQAQVATAVARTVTKFGRLDLAYNNTGIVGPIGDVTDETAEGFGQVHAVNLLGI